MKRSDRILGSLLLLGAVVTIAYWANYFVAGDVRVVPDLWYSTFEDAFPVADVASFALGLTTVVMCWRRALASVPRI